MVIEPHDVLGKAYKLFISPWRNGKLSKCNTSIKNHERDQITCCCQANPEDYG